MWFFLKNICYFKIYPYLCTRNGLSARGRAWINYIDGTRHRAVCRASLERTFSKRYLSVLVKSSKFESSYSGDATEAFAWVILCPCAWFPFIYIIRCTPLGGYLCVYVYLGLSGRSVYISLDVGRLYVAYPYEGAMLEPDSRDRRGERHTPTSFFVSIILAVDKMANMTAGECGQHICCVYTQTSYIKLYFINI